MNERYKLPIPFAALFAFVGLVVSFVTTFMIIPVVFWSLRFGQANEISHYQIPDSLFMKISLFVAIGVAVFVFRIMRSKISPSAVFHTCFLTGLALLGYSMWIIAFIIRILNSDMEPIDQLYGGWFAVAGKASPVLSICMLIIPTALLLLAFATLYDKRTPHRCKCQPNETP